MQIGRKHDIVIMNICVHKRTLTMRSRSRDHESCRFLSSECVSDSSSCVFAIAEVLRIRGKSEGHGVGDLKVLSEEKWRSLLHNTYHIKPILL